MRAGLLWKPEWLLSVLHKYTPSFHIKAKLVYLSHSSADAAYKVVDLRSEDHQTMCLLEKKIVERGEMSLNNNPKF